MLGKNKKIAPAVNETRVCIMAGYYSTTRPLVLFERLTLHILYITKKTKEWVCMNSSFNGRTIEGYDNVVFPLCNKLMRLIITFLIHGDI